MANRIGIRREDMYAWERRTPLIPQDAKSLVTEAGLEVIAQSSDKRVFTDADYRQAGIPVMNELTDCPVIIGIKEIPIPVLKRQETYVFFSHTIKGQSYNMPMLQRILDLGCTLIDYEKITNDAGHRLIFFGNYAGLAGMIETLWALGERLASEGIDNPFSNVRRALDYPDLEAAKEALRLVGEEIKAHGLPSAITPLVIGFAGYGNVSRGAQEILDILPVREITPHELLSLPTDGVDAANVVLKVVFREQDIVEPLETAHMFDLQDYYTYPEQYRGVFDRYLPHLDVLVNCVYWEPRYPRLASKADIRALTESGQMRLKVIGDITCDVEGAIECTVKATEPDNPVFVYNPATGQVIDGVEGFGPVIMAVEILPSELPRESSTYFSGVLKEYLPAIATADYTSDFEHLNLPREIKRAVIAHRGRLTSGFRYIEQYL